MASTSKKRTRQESEISSDEKTPIIFRSPGFDADVRTTVFDQQYHAQSVCLKLYSAFFRKFLASADKQAAPASSEFKYEYISVIDKDGSWGLEPTSKAKTLPNDWKTKVPEYLEEQECFRKLLCATHNRPYKIVTVSEIFCLATIADYYRALPLISGSVDGTLFCSAIFEAGEGYENYRSFVMASARILVTAKKLRHLMLFRECLVYVVAKYGLDFYAAEDEALIQEDTELHLLVLEGQSRLDQLLQETNDCLVSVLISDDRDLLDSEIMAEWAESIATEDPRDRADVHRNLKNHLERQHANVQEDAQLTQFVSSKELEASLDKLLKNQLQLDHGDCGTIGQEGGCWPIFLCIVLENQHTPWDVDQVNW